MKPAIILIAFTSLALGQGPLTPPGSPGLTMRSLDEIEPRIPLNQTTAPGDATCVFKITKPGSYILTGNLKPPAGKHGMLIALLVPGEVVVDMKNFTMDCTDSSPTASGVLCNNEVLRLNVHNGTFRADASTNNDMVVGTAGGTLVLSNLYFQGGCNGSGDWVSTPGRLLMSNVSMSGGCGTSIQTGPDSVLSSVEIRGSGARSEPLISTGDHGVLEGVSLTWSFGASNPTSAVLLGAGSRVSGMTARISGGTFSGPVFANSSGFTDVSGLTQELTSVTAPSAYLGWAMQLGDTGTHERGGSLARDAGSGMATGSDRAAFPSQVVARNCTFTTAVGIISTACPIASYAPGIRIEGTTTAPAVLRVENSHCTIAADITLAPTSNITGGVIRVYGAANTISSSIRGMVGGGPPAIEILNEQGTAVIGCQLSGRRDSAVTGIRIAAGATNVLVANNRATGFAAGSAFVNNLGGSTNAITPVLTTPAQLTGNTNPLANIIH